MGYELVVSGEANEDRRQVVREALTAFNRAACAAMADEPGHLDLYLPDGAGQVRGGLLGDTLWGWLGVDELAVAPELRGQGLGSLLMQRVEAEARRRGLTRCVLDTATFQARPFYEKLGYRLIGELADVLPGAGCYWLAKGLDAAPAREGAIPPGYQVVVTSTRDAERSKQVAGILMEFNAAQNEAIRQAVASGHWGDPLDVYLVDGQGAVAGGLVATRRWRELRLGPMWIAEALRGQGWGRRLVAAAEAEAARQGCGHVATHVHGFQAPGFWQRLGYRCIGQMEDYPPPYAYLWLTKSLSEKPIGN